MGAWFEAKIVKISMDDKSERKTDGEEMETDDDGQSDHDGYIYSVVFDG